MARAECRVWGVAMSTTHLSLRLAAFTWAFRADEQEDVLIETWSVTVTGGVQTVKIGSPATTSLLTSEQMIR